MLVKTFASAVHGIDAQTITVEVDAGGAVAQGKPGYSLVGLPDNAVREGYFRIESALKAIGYRIPRIRVVINMAPADIRKEGSNYDLPLAIGIMAATQQIPATEVADYLIMGELSLDGTIQPIKGALPIAVQARKENFKGFILPKANAREAAIVNNLAVFGVENIDEVIGFFEGRTQLEQTIVNTREEFAKHQSSFSVDFSDVRGQENIKRALEIAAAGGHNAILIGPPGSGKTMLAKRLPTILPPLSLSEALETTKIHSVVGLMPSHASLITERPFRNPHHTISDVALVGGGNVPKPGEISLAHNGVLFLDELPEFQRSVLEVLRQPIEARQITISRSRFTVDYPASFMLIAAMNPCPCGFYNDPEKECSCPPVGGSGVRRRSEAHHHGRAQQVVGLAVARARGVAEDGLAGAVQAVLDLEGGVLVDPVAHAQAQRVAVAAGAFALGKAAIGQPAAADAVDAVVVAVA